MDEVLSDTKPSQGKSIGSPVQTNSSIPSLHVSLTVLLSSRVIELKGPQASSCHEQESDILDVLYLLFFHVL
jgi:hypothetical protein